MPESYRPLKAISGTVTAETAPAAPPPHRPDHHGHSLVEKLYVELIRFGAHADVVVIDLINRIKSEFR